MERGVVTRPLSRPADRTQFAGRRGVQRHAFANGVCGLAWRWPFGQRPRGNALSCFSTIPIAILCNVIRVLVTALIYIFRSAIRPRHIS